MLMCPARQDLNPLEQLGVWMPGFLHLVANHLATLVGNVELLSDQAGTPPEAVRSVALIQQSASKTRNELDRLRAIHQRALAQADATLPKVPLPELADALTKEFSQAGWEVQRGRAVGSAREVRAEKRWLAPLVHALLEAVGHQPGLTVFYLSRGHPDSSPDELRIHLLRDSSSNERLVSASLPALEVARQIVTGLGGSLEADLTRASTQITLNIPLLATDAL